MTVRQRRLPIGMVFLETCTWVGMVGTVSTIAASSWGSATFTLAVAFAGAVVSLIRRASARSLTRGVIVVELLTLFVVLGIVNNPSLRGLEGVLAVLGAWIVVEVARHLLRRATTDATFLGGFAILMLLAILADGRTFYGVGTPVILTLWLALELAWAVIDPRLFSSLRLRPSLSARQRAALVTIVVILLALYVAQTVHNITTFQYYGRTVDRQAMLDEGRPLHCVQLPWRVLGVIDISFLGFTGFECFNTDAEARGAMR